MWPESIEQPKKLRTGLTTGCCATGCSVAAAEYLLSGKPAEAISVTLPKGKMVDLMIIEQGLNTDEAFASTIKDAGDDPDVTHGAEITVHIKKMAQPTVCFAAGAGVGTVTREGLLLSVGEPAINPVPRQMMTSHLQQIAQKYQYPGGFKVTISVENGQALAMKTMNPRLGIEGGLSILGTSGIVRPFSCSAYIASIHQAVDVARANGIQHIAASTGNASEEKVKNKYGLGDMALIEMGDFAGALLKYLRRQPVNHLTICGGFGKISKLADGHIDLHSRASSINLDFISDQAKQVGADAVLQQQIIQANTSTQALSICQAQSLPLGDRICALAQGVAKHIIRHDMRVNVIAIDRMGNEVGHFGDTV